MSLSAEGKAEVVLKKHGKLIHELVDHRIILTLEGRVFLITYLQFTNYLTKRMFNYISETEKDPGMVAHRTGVMLRRVCEQWLKDNQTKIEEEGEAVVEHTDIKYKQLALLMQLLVAAQSQLEQAASRQKV